VLLDWFSGHLTDEVKELIAGKGHVLLFHGGGTTPFTQVNDTHLHAQLAALLIKIENEWQLSERTRLLAKGQNKTPSPSREDIVQIVQAAWLSINHGRVAEKGYKQTGPTMPLRGPVAHEDVYVNLLEVLEKLAPSQDPTEVNMSMRDEAIVFVREGFDSGKWTTWRDCHKLISEHDADTEGLVEGLEAFGAIPHDDDDDSFDGSGDEDPGGCDGDYGGGGGAGHGDKPDEADYEGDDEEGEDEDGDTGGDGGAIVTLGDAAPAALVESDAAEGAESSVVLDSKHLKDIAAARVLIYDNAMKTRDDPTLKVMRKLMKEHTRDQKAVGTEVNVLLHKRAMEQQAACNKRRCEEAEVERLAAKDIEETKKLRAQADKAAQEAKVVQLKLIVQNRREDAARKRMEFTEKAYQRWLQTVYPLIIADKCIILYRGLSVATKKGFEKEVRACIEDHSFERPLHIFDLWVADPSLSIRWAEMKCPHKGPNRVVRCGLQFQALLDKECPIYHGMSHDPELALLKLVSACVPHARTILQGRLSTSRFLEMNGFIMEKAFIYIIISLSKWMGEKVFKSGIFGTWPPPMPAELVTLSLNQELKDLEMIGTKPSTSASSSSKPA
jgi:hypothetical protein